MRIHLGKWAGRGFVLGFVLSAGLLVWMLALAFEGSESSAWVLIYVALAGAPTTLGIVYLIEAGIAFFGATALFVGVIVNWTLLGAALDRISARVASRRKAATGTETGTARFSGR